MRHVFLLATLLPLAACGDSGADRTATGAPAGAERIACALQGAARFERVCTVERSVGPEGLVLTVRGPGGGFRRLLVTKDGRGVIAADGAEQARVSSVGARLIEVRVGNDRYRLPATVRPGR